VSVIYLIFDAGPSEAVRARAFEVAYRTAGYRVKYFRLYAPWLVGLIALGERFRILGSLKGLGYALQRVVRSVKMLYALAIVGRYHAAVVLKWSSVGFLRRLRRHPTTKLLYDFDDAMWLDAFVGERTFADLVGLADCVSCDNAILAAHARRYQDDVIVVEGPPQVEQFVEYQRRKPPSSGETVSIGWVGSPYTLFYLYGVIEALEVVGRRFANVELVLLGTGFNSAMVPAFESMRVRRIPQYDQSAMVRFVSTFDIGLFPLFDNEMSLGRGALKARIYMSAGVPVVASRLGENVRLIEDGETGLLASTRDEWIDAMSRLIENRALRQQIGARAQEVMRERCRVATSFRQLEERFLSRLG